MFNVNGSEQNFALPMCPYIFNVLKYVLFQKVLFYFRYQKVHWYLTGAPQNFIFNPRGSTDVKNLEDHYCKL